MNKGIVYIEDLLDEDSNFLSLAGLKEKFQEHGCFDCKTKL